VNRPRIKLPLPLLPHLLWMACLCLCAGSLLPSLAQAQTTTHVQDAASSDAFSLEILAPDSLSEGLSRHLELQRYKTLHDLDAIELQRLLTAADAQARDLLATWGYFSPELQWRTDAGLDNNPRWRVQLQVAPGPQARIAEVHWHFSGHLFDSDAHQDQRQALQQQWSLPPGQVFTQDAWNEAKANALRQLTADHYPLGRMVSSEARVDAEHHSVVLSLALDSGPEVFLGPVLITGSERYDEEQARRLARIPVGSSYHQSELLEAQQRLVLSGFYDAVFVNLDTESRPPTLPVRIELKETPRQRWQLGVGARSDTGARLTLEHTQHRVPALDWRAVTKLSLDKTLQSLSLDLLAPPNPQLWRWTVSGKAEHQDYSGYAVTSQRLRAGRTQLGDRVDRSYYAQYDNAVTRGDTSGTRNALSAHYAWAWRHFDSLPFPTRGWGLGLELGTGYTLGEERIPFVRSYSKGLWLLPLGNQGQRIALRSEAAAVATRNANNIPSTQLFLAGGDQSVRGYAPGSIGVNTNGIVTAGRYMLTGSVEWLWPIRLDQRRTEWDGLLFVDGGAVANTPNALQARMGAGLGARWRSPVGPLEIDLARATDTGQWRLHLNVGFRF
jgi:translocation and assembly module TamA